jgi:hypothetical protein
LAEFALDDAVVLMGVFDDSLAHLHVLFPWLMAPINHHAGEAFIDALLAQLEAIAMIEVNGNRDGREADGCLDKLLEVDGVCILAGSLRNLEHDRGLVFLAGLDDGLKQLHVVDVEGAEGVFAFQSFGEEVPRVGKWHIS